MTVYPAPKPERAPPQKQQFSSIRERSTSEKLAAQKKMRAKRKALPKKNVERQQRVAVIRRQKHAAYRRSDCYKAVEKRAGGRCERWQDAGPVVVDGKVYRSVMRCTNRRLPGCRMTHNHKTYARYGGHEQPSDMELLCPSCNALYESQKRGNRRFAGRAAGGEA